MRKGMSSLAMQIQQGFGRKAYKEWPLFNPLYEENGTGTEWPLLLPLFTL